MRHLVWKQPGDVAWETAEDPHPGPDDAVIRPLAVARCDFDPVVARLGLYPGPFPVGHEVMGEVIATGPDVTAHAIGDRVMVPFQVSCGGCDACRDHRFAACHTHRSPVGAAFGFGRAGGDHGGAVADQLLVPHADHMLLAAPVGLAPVRLCLIPDNGVDAYRAVAPHLAASPGADVLVVGGAAPSVGLYAVAIAKALGAGTVRYVDEHDGRCREAEGLGADVVEHAGEWPKRFGRFPITVDNTGDGEGLACVIRSTDDYGDCTPVAFELAAESRVPLLAMYTKGITLHLGRADSRRHLQATLDLITAGRIHLEGINSRIVPFDDAAEAWLDAPGTKLVLTREAAR